MQRAFKQTKLGDGRVKSVVQLISDPCPAEGQESAHFSQQLLSAMSDRPDICNCGLKRFQLLRMKHNGSAWVVEMEALDDSPS